MRALITGSGGFAGPYLDSVLRGEGHHVTGFDLRDGFDVRNYEQILAVIRDVSPDWVFHLAAISWPREAAADPRRCVQVNIAGTLNVLEAVRVSGSHARVLLAGTSEEYGYAGRSGEVLGENSECRPASMYGITKLAAGQAGLHYHRQHGLPVVVTRAFNHTGPGRQSCNAESAFARRIIAYERGQCDAVVHGELSAVRNFSDVRDVMRAYRLAIMCEPGVYNICSDTNVSMGQVLDMLTAAAGGPVPLKQDPRLTAPAEGAFPVPSHAKLTAATGWQPMIPLADTLEALLKYWRAR